MASCSVKKCRKYKNLDDDGYCPLHSKVDIPAEQKSDQNSAITDNVDCCKCSSVVLDTDTALDCDLCRKFFHAKCINLPETILQYLTDANIQPIGLRWFCTDCISTVESIKPPPCNNDSSLTSRDDGESAETSETKTVKKSNASSPQTAICKNYRRGTCKHGASGKNLINGSPCHYRHPRKCPKFIKFGRNRTNGCDKERCELFHPILCRNSVRNSECLNKSCTYTHLRGTARKRPPFSQPETTDNRKNYAVTAASPVSFNPGSNFRQKPVEFSYPQQRDNHTYIVPNVQEDTMSSILRAIKELQENQLKMQQEFLRYKNPNFLQPLGRAPMTEMPIPGQARL